MDLQKIQNNTIPAQATQDRSGEFLRETDPEKYNKVVDMLRQGAAISVIREECKPISRNTITAIRDRNNLDADWRRQTANKMKRVVSMISDRLDEEVDNIPVGQLAIAGAITIDQIAKLENKPVAIIRHESARTHDDLNAKLQALEAEVIVDAEVIHEDQDTRKPAHHSQEPEDG